MTSIITIKGHELHIGDTVEDITDLRICGTVQAIFEDSRGKAMCVVEILEIPGLCVCRVGENVRLLKAVETPQPGKELIKSTANDLRAFFNRWDKDKVDDMTEKQWGKWLDTLPRNEWLAMMMIEVPE